jgi:adenylate cyclase class 2
MTDQHLEIEVKFLVRDLDAVHQRLLEAGAESHKARVFEINYCYDTLWDSLMLQGKLLRLRQDTVARITYKGHPEEAVESEARVREELEIEVEDFNITAAILERVGFQRRQVYEKYRQTFRLGQVEVVLDEMPFGDFVELEGEERALRAAATRLGLDWQHRILANYLALMAQLKEHHDLSFDDLTFANFTDIEARAADILEYAT